MKYILKNTKTKLYFKGYAGEGKILANKPIWTKEVGKALQLVSDIAEHTRCRLFCQSQYVELELVVGTGAGRACTTSSYQTARKQNNVPNK